LSRGSRSKSPRPARFQVHLILKGEAAHDPSSVESGRPAPRGRVGRGRDLRRGTRSSAQFAASASVGTNTSPASSPIRTSTVTAASAASAIWSNLQMPKLFARLMLAQGHSSREFPSFSRRRKWPSQPRTPAIKSFNGVQSPRLRCSGIGLTLGWRIVLIRRRTESWRPRFQATSLT
jgi:hypothetical protein